MGGDTAKKSKGAQSPSSDSAPSLADTAPLAQIKRALRISCVPCKKFVSRNSTCSHLTPVPYHHRWEWRKVPQGSVHSWQKLPPSHCSAFRSEPVSFEKNKIRISIQWLCISLNWPNHTLFPSTKPSLQTLEYNIDITSITSNSYTLTFFSENPLHFLVLRETSLLLKL